MMRYPFVYLFVVLGLLQGCTASGVAAGVGASMMVTSSERRSPGAMVEDETIQSKSQKRIEEKYKDTVHATITAYNRFVLITGTTASEDAKMEIEHIVGSVPNVKGIANELVVGAAQGIGTNSNDSLITSSVKTRFVSNKAFKAEHVKVVTDNAVVYLMGLVSHAEADAASDVASTTRGVQKVVRVFEYID